MNEFDVIVIGSGSGLEVSSEAVERGLSVAVMEEGPFGGTCLNRGCIPSKMLIHTADVSSGPHHQDSGEAKIRESTAGVSRKPSSDGKACGCSSKHLCGLTAWNT